MASDIVTPMRTAIVQGMANVPAWVVFRVNDQELFQTLAAPHELTGSSGVAARARKLTSTQAISFQGVAVGAQVWECQTVGTNATTPNMAALMKASNTWEIRLGEGSSFIPARVIELSPSELGMGWRVLLEVFPT